MCVITYTFIYEVYSLYLQCLQFPFFLQVLRSSDESTDDTRSLCRGFTLRRVLKSRVCLFLKGRFLVYYSCDWSCGVFCLFLVVMCRVWLPVSCPPSVSFVNSCTHTQMLTGLICSYKNVRRGMFGCLTSVAHVSVWFWTACSWGVCCLKVCSEESMGLLQWVSLSFGITNVIFLHGLLWSVCNLWEWWSLFVLPSIWDFLRPVMVSDF